ncbi:transcriptional regulator [Alphaproteobacteria bacterium]|nr:transcriptional regulator [Alphaproteobacteria bacterium]
MAIILKTEDEILKDIAARSREVRLTKNLSQLGLANRAGVSLGSLKRFESTGEISLKSLVKIMFVLECVHQSECLFEQMKEISSLNDLKKLKCVRRRGHENH